MQLLVVILHHEEVLDDVLSTLVEYGYPDSVVLQTQTGLGLLERDLPVFAGVRTLVPGGLDFCRTVLCLVEDGQAGEVLDGLREITVPSLPGEAPTTAFLLPVTMAHRL